MKSLTAEIFSWFHLSNVFLLFLSLLVNVGLVSWHFYTSLKYETRYDSLMADNQAIRTHIALLGEHGAIREIVMEKLPTVAPNDQAKIAFEIYEGSRRTGIPSWLILAIIETESGWKLDATSPVGAQGLMQIMPATGMAYARITGITVSNLQQLYDPVTNIRLCIQVLYDNHVASMMQGLSPQGDYTRALWMYNSGGKPGAGEEYARKVMSVAAPYQKRLRTSE